MAKFTKKIELLDIDKQFIKTYLKPYLEKNDMESVRKYLCGINTPSTWPDELYDQNWHHGIRIRYFLLQSLGEETYFNGSKEIFYTEFCSNTSDCSLVRISLPNNIKIIGKFAFLGSKDLEVANIGGVERIGEMSFAGCYNLKKVFTTKNLELIDVGAFDGCARLDSIYIPHGALYSKNRDFHSNTKILSW